MELIDLDTKISTQSFTFVLTTDLWEFINSDVKKYIFENQWTGIKYLDSNGEFCEEVGKIPTDKGGIYLFFINPDIIKNHHKFLCYIGRAHKTKYMNLRTRVKCYIDYEKAPKKLDRPKLRKLFQIWWNHIYCYYLPISNEITICNKSGNDLIDFIEAELINGLLPPCNTKIPDVYIAAMKERAFM